MLACILPSGGRPGGPYLEPVRCTKMASLTTLGLLLPLLASANPPRPTDVLLDIASTLIDEARQLTSALEAENARRLSSSSVQRVKHGGLVHEFADGEACLGTGQSPPLMTSSEEGGAAACRMGPFPPASPRPHGLAPFCVALRARRRGGTGGAARLPDLPRCIERRGPRLPLESTQAP